MQKHITACLLGFLLLVALAHSTDQSIKSDEDVSSTDEEQVLQDRNILNEGDDLSFESVDQPLGRRAMFERKELTAGRRQASSFTKEQRTFQKEMLDAHNNYRARHCARSLTLDDTINRSAQNYAQYLAKINQMVHSQTRGLGENLYMKRSSAVIKKNSGTEGTDAWYNEVKLYNFNRPGFAMDTGHFTQLVWKGSQKLGAGFAFTNDGRSLYVVAQYSPPGNYLNEFQKNVSPASC